MPRSRSPRRIICDTCKKDVRDYRYFVINGNKRHWNCCELVTERLQIMQDSILAGDENAVARFYDMAKLMARIDGNTSADEASFEMVGYDQYLQDYRASLMGIWTQCLRFDGPSKEAYTAVMDFLTAELHKINTLERGFSKHVPPRRPNSTTRIDKDRNCFMMDFENALLKDWTKPIVKGKNRHEDPEWAKFVKSQVYPHSSDIDWYEYVNWVKEGYGDEWLTDEDVNPPAFVQRSSD
jgi:hypothetical protein